jgi:hypothetical protein
MYDFIRDYPSSRENGFSNECQGVCHDLDNWYFTQNGNLWKIPLTQDLNQKFSGTDEKKGIIKCPYGGHLGDMDYYEYRGIGYLLVADNEGANKTYISVFRASDLAWAGRYPIYKDSGRFKDVGWCAVNEGFLYTSDGAIEGADSPVYVFKLDPLDQRAFAKPYAKMILRNEAGEIYRLHDMQGGCFDDQNHFHLCNGYIWPHEDGLVWKRWRPREGIHVFTVPDYLQEGYTYTLTRICKSSLDGPFQYKISENAAEYEEPEGITWWDLDQDERAPYKVRGQLHAILLDNDSLGDDDDLIFKHFRRTDARFHFPRRTKGEIFVTVANVSDYQVTTVALYPEGWTEPLKSVVFLGNETGRMGEFWDGTYTVKAKADGYPEKSATVKIADTTLNVHFKMKPDPIIIKSLYAELDRKPEVGLTPSDISVVNVGSTGAYVSYVQWWRIGSNSELRIGPDFPFAAGDRYKCYVTFEPRDGYAFPVDPLKLDARINGEKAIVISPDSVNEALVRAEFFVERKIAPVVRPLPGKRPITGVRPITGIRREKKDSCGG